MGMEFAEAISSGYCTYCRASEKKAFLLTVCAALGHCAGLAGAETISFIVATLCTYTKLMGP